MSFVCVTEDEGFERILVFVEEKRSEGEYEEKYFLV